jgi:CheY-like chemotaxis protein
LLLFIEDNQVNLEVVHDYLVQKGFAILVVRNGREAISQAELHQPDLIVLDIQMPKLDGLSAIERLRAGGAPARSRRLSRSQLWQ